MSIFNAFISGLCCAAAVFGLREGDWVIGLLNLVLCLINGAIAIRTYKREHNF